MRCFAPLLLLLVVGCAEPGADELDDPLAPSGKADAEPWCDLQDGEVGVQLSTLPIGLNVCHERGASTRLEIGDQAQGRVRHEHLGDELTTVGCTAWDGELPAVIGAQGALYRIPVTEGQRLLATLDEESDATLDVLERVRWSESTSQLRFSEAGATVEVTDDGGDALVHPKDGERFVVVRVRVARVCPSADGADFTLTISE